MNSRPKNKASNFSMPATYSILVEGFLEENWAERLAGMHIQTIKRENEPAMTTLSGQLTDQAELLGVLNALYNLKMPLMAVKRLDKK